MSEPVIRRASPCDAEALAAIGRDTFVETFGHLYPREDLQAFLADAYHVESTRAELDDAEKAAWLVEADDEVIGYAQAGPCGLPHPDVTAASGELKRIYFLKSSQGTGLGARLFAEVMAWLQRNGPRDVWIGVWSENHGAQRFYARHGFEKVGEYGFHVGRTVDHEFILRRTARSFSQGAAQAGARRPNTA
jgi:ribosomal protein S18 acetylase RimI-like enzyme